MSERDRILRDLSIATDPEQRRKLAARLVEINQSEKVKRFEAFQMSNGKWVVKDTQTNLDVAGPFHFDFAAFDAAQSLNGQPDGVEESSVPIWVQTSVAVTSDTDTSKDTETYTPNPDQDILDGNFVDYPDMDDFINSL